MQSEATYAQELFFKFESMEGFDREKAEYQTVKDQEITRLLESKGGKGRGKPEMVYRLGPNDLLVWEIKQDIKDFSSISPEAPIGFLEVALSKPKEKAEDGIVHYMNCLKKAFNVIGIAAAPNGGSWKISTFRAKEGGRIEKLDVKTILSPSEYLNLIDAAFATKETPAEIQEFSTKLYNFLRDEMKLPEVEKPLLVSGVMVALEDDTFRRIFRNFDGDYLQEQTLIAIKNVLEANTNGTEKQGQVQKLDVMMSAYRRVIAKEATKDKLKQVITEIKRNLHNVDHHKQSFDLLGHFYGEFLKHSGGDKKGLGIVLTPNHITSLFARIANLEYGDCALDICTGTAGFLIAAMAQMVAKYEGEPDKLDKILEDAFLGIEFDENNYTLACANMLLRGGGKSNIRHGNCFDKAFNNIESATFGKPKVTFLNPPYSQKKKGEHELDFIARACELTKQGGTVIAIVPMSCVCEQKKETVTKRALLLEKNTLTAVMSMPDGLFPTVGTVTCILVLQAGVPHTDKKETWFAYWKDDGFKLKKNVRTESEPWWDIQKREPEEIEQLADPVKKEKLKAVDGWVYPANTWQPLEKTEWVKGKKPTTDPETGKKLIKGKESQWVYDFFNQKERVQYAVKVNLYHKARELKEQAIADEIEELLAEGNHPEIAKQKAIEKNQHWSPAFIEWCAEAYLETDYSQLTKEVFEESIKNFVIQRFSSPDFEGVISTDAASNENVVTGLA